MGKQSRGKVSDSGDRSGRGGNVRVTCSNCGGGGEVTVDVAGGRQTQPCNICDGKGWYWGPAA